MTPIENSADSKQKKPSTNKKSMLIDMTPMVDLGFLLISFFMLTTSLAKPVAMNLSMPVDTETRDVEESRVLNIICDKDKTIWYYEGLTISKLNQSDYSANGIRKVILDKQKSVDLQWKKDTKGDTKTICLIKFTDQADYNSMIDVLDEMDITSTKIYAVQHISNTETQAIAKENL